MRLLTIWFGANDACLSHSVQHVPLEKFSENLTKLIQMVTSATSSWYSPITNIILITPPPFNPAQWMEVLLSRDPSSQMDRTPENTARYAQAVRGVGEKAKIPVVDVHSEILNAAGGKLEALRKYLSDGLHLTEEGYKVCIISENTHTLRC